MCWMALYQDELRELYAFMDLVEALSSGYDFKQSQKRDAT